VSRPFSSFAEYATVPNPETKKKDVVWFALNDGGPLAVFATMARNGKLFRATST
jgi:hypothetical protein